MVLPPLFNTRKLPRSHSDATGNDLGPTPSSSVSETIRQATVLNHDRDNMRHASRSLPIGVNSDLSRLSNLELQRNLDLLGARSQISRGLSPSLSQLLAARDSMPYLQSQRLAGLGLDAHLPLHMAAATQGIGPSLAETLLARQRQLDSSAFLQFARASQAAAASSALSVEMLQSVASGRPTTTSPGPLSSLAHAAAGSPALEEGKGMSSSQNPKSLTGTTDSPLLIDKPREWDVLCGRGGRSNHHPGNKRYRQVISEMKARYRNIEAKSAKTDLSRAIVEHVFGYGGRFVKLDKPSGKYEVLSALESRKKTSQALRETKELKWTL